MLGSMNGVRDSQPVHIAQGSVFPGWFLKLVGATVSIFGVAGTMALISVGGSLAEAKEMRRDIDANTRALEVYEKRITQVHTILCMQCVEQFGRDRCGDKAACKL